MGQAGPRKRRRNAFNNLKEKLISFPMLRLCNPLADTELHTDASSLAIAAILFAKARIGPIDSHCFL